MSSNTNPCRDYTCPKPLIHAEHSGKGFAVGAKWQPLKIRDEDGAKAQNDKRGV